MAAELAPRAAGLIPLWLVPALALAWAALYGLACGPLRRHRRLRHELPPLGLLAVAHLLFFWRPLLTPAQVPRGGGDLNSFFFPLHAFSASAMRNGDLPLWNPSLHGGLPQLANFQAALLYPPNLLAYLLARPFSYATLERLAIGHYGIAAVGAYALGRALGMTCLPAALTGLIFSSSGFLVAHLGHYSMLSAAVWLPWLLLAVRHLAVRRSWLGVTGVAITVWLMTTAGHQQTLLYGLTVAAAWWLFWVIVGRGAFTADAWTGAAAVRDALRTTPIRGWLADIGRAALALVLGLALAAPALLPSLQLADRSVRAGGLSYEDATAFSIEPIALVHFVLPKVFGSNPTDFWGPFSSGEIWGYVGIATLVLAALALAIRPRPTVVLIAGLGSVALLYALGPWLPVHGWAYRFAPLYDVIRAPARAYLVLDLALALLAGLGLQAITRREPDDRRARVLGATVRTLIIALGAIVLVALPLFYSLVLGANDPSNRPVIAIDGLNLLVIFLGGTILLLWATARDAISTTAAGLLALGLVTLDLFAATATFNPTPEDLTAGFHHPEAVAFLQERLAADERFRIDAATLAWQPDLAAVAGLDDVGGLYDPMQPATYAALRDAARADRSAPLYDLLNARYLITDATTDAPSGFREALRTTDGLVIWENDDAMPRVWLAYAADGVPADEALQRVRQPGFDPRRDLYISGSLPAAEPGGVGTARIAGYEPDVVRVAVETDRAAYLILADVDYPGWRATIDGEPAATATADGVFRAVRVPAGSHEVVWRFAPPLVRVGTALAAAGAVGILAVSVVGLRRRARASRRDS